jgi:hypothetical protein
MRAERGFDSHIQHFNFMTVEKKDKSKKAFKSSREWAEGCLNTIKKIQDEFLDNFYDGKIENEKILTLLNKLVTLIEKKMK